MTARVNIFDPYNYKAYGSDAEFLRIILALYFQTFQCDVCEKQLCNLNALKCHRCAWKKEYTFNEANKSLLDTLYLFNINGHSNRFVHIIFLFIFFIIICL